MIDLHEHILEEFAQFCHISRARQHVGLWHSSKVNPGEESKERRKFETPQQRSNRLQNHRDRRARMTDEEREVERVRVAAATRAYKKRKKLASSQKRGPELGRVGA